MAESPGSRLLDSKLVEKAMGALKKEDEMNKRCADCGVLGPTYVNTSLNTFVCSRCAGLLREFSFKVKGISTSKFTADEMEQLKAAGGNSNATAKWLGSYRLSQLECETFTRDAGFAKEHLTDKYMKKKWYNAATATSGGHHQRTGSAPSNLGLLVGAPPMDIGHQRAKSTASSSSLGLIAPPLASPQQSRSRAHSRSASASGGAGLGAAAIDLKTLMSTRTSSSSSSSNDAGDDDDDDDEDDEDDEEDAEGGEAKKFSLLDKHLKEEKILRRKMIKFYTKYNPDRLSELETYMDWTLYHGVEAFNAKLMEKYGAKLPHKKKVSKAKERREKAALSVENSPGMRSASPGVALTKPASPKLVISPEASKIKSIQSPKTQSVKNASASSSSSAPAPAKSKNEINPFDFEEFLSTFSGNSTAKPPIQLQASQPPFDKSQSSQSPFGHMMGTTQAHQPRNDVRLDPFVIPGIGAGKSAAQHTQPFTTTQNIPTTQQKAQLPNLLQQHQQQQQQTAVKSGRNPFDDTNLIF